MSKILVTGAAGFIGSNTCAELLRKGHSVIGIDNMSHGHVRNLQDFRNNNNFTFVEADVKYTKTFEKYSDIDAIIHLAALKIPKYGGVVETMDTNVTGTKNVLDHAKNCGAKVVFASSSDVYGMAPVPFNEDTTRLIFGNSKVKRWSYSASKLFDEHMCFAYYQERNVPVVIMRFFNVYGPNNLDPNPQNRWFGGPFPVFIEAALDNESLIVHGSGKQTRTFTYISDTVNGIIKCMETKDAVGEIFNIGNIKEYTILEIAEMIKKASGSHSEIRLIGHEELFGKYEEIDRRVPDITKAKKVLGFIPKIDLEEGTEKTVAWHRSLRGKK